MDPGLGEPPVVEKPPEAGDGVPPEAELKLGAGADLAPAAEAPVIELGDRIRILGGRLDKTTGRVVLRTETEIHLMPDGLSDRILEFPITEEGFDPELGIEAVDILQKRKKSSLVEILDLKVDQQLETFASDGSPVGTYTIIAVDPERDLIVVENEAEGQVTIPFGFRGVLDMPFKVIRGREPPQKVGVPVVPGEAEQAAEGQAVEEEEEYDDFQFLDDELEEEAPAEDAVERLIAIPTSEIIYSDIRQKSEAYTDLLSLYTPEMQKMAQVQHNVSVLTELFFQLRKSILRTSQDGTPLGLKPTGFQTLIDALETRLVGLSRSVLDISKRLYHDARTPENTPQDTETVKFEHYRRSTLKSNEYLEESPDINGQKFNTFMNNYLAQFASTWQPVGGELKVFVQDEEAFRLRAPDPEGSVPGYAIGLPGHGFWLEEGFLGEVSMSIVRGLKAISAKGQVIQLGEEAAVLAYVVFPMMYSYLLTTYRQESIAKDITAGMKMTAADGVATMKELLSATGDITDIPTADAPFLIGAEGGNLGNIPIREYLKALNLKLEGLGDIWNLQTLLGMREREWTIDQQEALLEIIRGTQDQVISEIIKEREALAAIAQQPPSTTGIQAVPEAAAMIEKLATEPILKDLQDKLKEEMPAYQASDVAQVGLLIRKYPELSFAQLADQAGAVAAARTQQVRKDYINELDIRQRIKDRKAFAGEIPKINSCTHVRDQEACRRIKDDNNRMAALSKNLAKYQGEKKDNWTHCNICKEHLFCQHEVLQIYQFLRPGDVNVLNKEIQLNFGGGQFQGYYICRVCGQPISEMELDTHLEFDDEGRPMAGRAELVDKDAVAQEEIELLLGPAGEMDTEEQFDNETKKLIYKTAKQLADRLFAPLEREHLKTITDRTYSVIQQIPTRERFIKIKRAQRNKRADKEINQDYDVYINQALVCALGVHMLIFIQAHKPDMILRGVPAGCRNLGGQPLDDEGTNGIQCVVSVISSFQRDQAPWNLTQFQAIADDTGRQKAIMAVFEPILKSTVSDPTIQQALAQKREYRRRILGALAKQGRPDEQLPDNFAPVPYQLRPEDFVKKVVVPEAASLEDRAELWIRQGNHVAKTNKQPMPLTFSEASCCLSSLGDLEEFWKREDVKDSLPAFPSRYGIPPPPKYAKTEPTMKPAAALRPLPDAPEEYYYQLFLRVCYDGEHKGMGHEFGITHKCMWCGLKLPEEAELLTPAAALGALSSQGIDINKAAFDDLLDATHRANRFETKFNLEAPGPLDTWISLMAIAPEPTQGYREVMAKTQAELAKLAVGADESEVALALSEFSVLTETMEASVKARLPPVQHANFDTILKDGPGSVTRFLQSYCAVPIKQFKQSKSAQDVIKMPDRWKLSEQHEMDIVQFLEKHRGYLTKFNSVKITPWLAAKIETCLAQVRSLLEVLSELRPIQVPGGEMTFSFLLKFCMYAPLANFVDPNVMPILLGDGVEAPASQVEEQAMFPARFISEMTRRFMEEGFRFTPEQVRELIAVRNEKEKDNILKDLSSLSPAARDIALLNMRLGMGRFYIAAKDVYQYNPDRYDLEREQRAAAGIIDFPGYGPEGPPPPGGREADGLGFFGGGEGGEGYIGARDLAGIMGFDEE